MIQHRNDRTAAIHTGALASRSWLDSRRFVARWFHIGIASVGVAASLLSCGYANAETRALIAAGIGGNPDYETEFQRHANRLAARLREVSQDVTVLIGGGADATAVQDALEELGGRLEPSDTLLFAYVGHGSWDGERFRFNVPGRDFTAEDLDGWLSSATAANQIVIVTGSSSGAVQGVLGADDRTVITGTRSGEQRNATVFGGYFTAALEDDAADVDKDRRITAIEAFRYAEAGIERHYSGAGEMTTEHPVSSGPEPVMVLALLEAQPENPAHNPLYARREAIELDIVNLRANRNGYSQDDYFGELQRLLLELAVIESQLDSISDEALP